MNKNGKTNVLVWILIIGAGALLLGFIDLPAGIIGGNDDTQVGGTCELAPSLTNSTVDAINSGTAITPTTTYVRVDGIYRGTTIPSSFEKGATGELILGGATYEDTKFNFGPLGCGVNNVNARIYQLGNATYKIFNDVGSVVTDDVAGGATNQSASATTIDQEFKIVAPADKSTGNMVCVFEATVTAEVSDIILSGATEVAVPKWYTVAGANSQSFAYDVPALKDGESKTYNLKIVPESGATIDDVGIYTGCYTKEWFVQPDGTFAYGVEDSDGTLKYDTTVQAPANDYDYFIT